MKVSSVVLVLKVSSVVLVLCEGISVCCEGISFVKVVVL